MIDNNSGERPGLIESLSALGATVVSIAQTRLDLLSTDLEEERENFFSLLILAISALFCLGVGVVLSALLLVVAFWDTHRLFSLVSLALLFLLAGMAAAWAARDKLNRKAPVFAASLAELRKDRQQISSRL